MKKRKRYQKILFFLLLGMLLSLPGCGKEEKTSPKEASVVEKEEEKEAVIPFDKTETEEYLTRGEGWKGWFWAGVFRKNGTIDFFDYQAGNPGIEGTYQVISEDRMEIQGTAYDFDPLPIWKGMKRDDVIEYRILDENHLELAYQGFSYVFHREEEEDLIGAFAEEMANIGYVNREEGILFWLDMDEYTNIIKLPDIDTLLPESLDPNDLSENSTYRCTGSQLVKNPDTGENVYTLSVKCWDVSQYGFPYFTQVDGEGEYEFLYELSEDYSTLTLTLGDTTLTLEKLGQVY